MSRTTVKIGCLHEDRLFRQLLAKSLGAIAIDHQGLWSEAIRDATVIVVSLMLPSRMADDVLGMAVENNIPVIILAPLPVPEPAKHLLIDCMTAAHGVISEEATIEDLQTAIAQVADGRRYYATEFVDGMWQDLSTLWKAVRWRTKVTNADLTEREVDVLEKLAQGLSNKQIAKKMQLSIYTVKNHVHKILSKLGADDRNEAVYLAIEKQLIRSPLSKLFQKGNANV